MRNAFPTSGSGSRHGQRLISQPQPRKFKNDTISKEDKSVKGLLRSLFVAGSLLGCTCVLGQGQSYSNDSGTLAAGVKVSTLGAGAEVALRVTHRTNVRAGFNLIDYSRGFNQDGVAYKGRLFFQTLEAHYDIFPWAKSWHVSPGVLVYAGDPITATAAVPANQTFSLGGVNYSSDPTNPVTGSGKIDFNRAAPMITVGWGNLISRQENKHFSVPFEVGVAFQGSPHSSLGLAGSVCDSTGFNCRPITSDPAVQANVVSEQGKINNNLSFFKVYPILSVGFGYKF
jgi:hypothetical protein